MPLKSAKRARDRERIVAQGRTMRAGRNLRRLCSGSLDEREPDLVVLAGFLVVLPPELIRKYEDRIINIHPFTHPFILRRGLLRT